MCNNAKWGHGSHPLGIAFIFKNTILGSFGSVRQLCKHQKTHPRSLLRGTRHHPHTKSTPPPRNTAGTGRQETSPGSQIFRAIARVLK